ncbi:hypothetical protein [Rhizobium phaseoli]|uniref:hypothetical protein n=1 Tax=Rhizobium phaseoli TaxID=396 RepID=UPI001CED2129|nr:hypothetical protein [Rhizobium phaseoli]MDK4728875.1 hypothetical protein [Rhizobium phaseoli]
MEDWFSYVMSFFILHCKMPLFLWRPFQTLSGLDDLQFAGVVIGDFGVASDDGSERPSGDSLKENYKILARHHDDASRMA